MTVLHLPLCRDPGCNRVMRPLIYPGQPTHPGCKDETGFWNEKFASYQKGAKKK